MFQQTSPTTSPTRLVTLYDDSYGSKDSSDIDSDDGSEDSIIDDNEDESAYKSDSSDLDNELDYDYEILDGTNPETSSTLDSYTDKSDLITTTETTTTSTSTSTTTSTTTTELVTDERTTELLTITTEFMMPTLGDNGEWSSESDGSDFSTEKSPITNTEFVTEAPKIPATWTEWKNDCDMCGCDCLKSKKFILMRTCELDSIPVDSSYCIGDETKFLDIDCTAQCSSSGEYSDLHLNKDSQSADYPGLSDYPYYSDIYKDSYTSDTDEITDDDDFTTGGSAEGSADGNTDKKGDENGSSR